MDEIDTLIDIDTLVDDLIEAAQDHATCHDSRCISDEEKREEGERLAAAKAALLVALQEARS